MNTTQSADGVQGAQTLQNSDPNIQRDRRLNTFTHWNSKKSSMQLAVAGFIYTGIADKVECQSCGIRLYNWQEDEDSLQAHKQHAPDCEFMLENFPNVKTPTKATKFTTMKYPYYVNYDERLKSFDAWPLKCVAQKPEVMAKCGFFYIGSSDRVRCHFCGVTLRDWDIHDYPPCVHRQLSENCPFIQSLDVDAIKGEIEDMEGMEKGEIDGSHVTDCSSSKKQAKVVTDGVLGATATTATQVYSQVSDLSTDGLAFNPAIQAVVEMGYTQEVIQKAFEKGKKEGISNPNASSLLEAILDMEG